MAEGVAPPYRSGAYVHRYRDHSRPEAWSLRLERAVWLMMTVGDCTPYLALLKQVV